VGVADQGRVVPPDERAVERRADARIGLCTDDDESPDPKARQHGLEGGVLKGVAIVLLDERLGVVRGQLADNPPVVAAPRKLLVGVLEPDNGNPLSPRLLDKAADIRDHHVALVGPLDDAVLHVDDHECSVRPVIERGHGLPLLTLGSCVHPTVDRSWTR
jgi:hypothetical protein